MACLPSGSGEQATLALGPLDSRSARMTFTDQPLLDALLRGVILAMLGLAWVVRLVLEGVQRV